MKISVAPLLKEPMGSSDDYHFEERPIDPHGENADLLEADITSIEADVKATHTNPGALLEGDARATVAQQCSRCLKEIDTPVETQFAEQYYATLNVDSGAPMPAPPLDAKTIGTDFRIDLTPLLREEVILATPPAPLCELDCKGLCLECGRDLNVFPHEHEEVVDQVWGELAKLKDINSSE
jgi:uncharacterized protein